MSTPNAPEHVHPKRLTSALHTAKVWGVTARHVIGNALNLDLVRHPQAPPTSWPVVGESHAMLWRNQQVGEWRLEAGKVENLRVATRLLDGVIIPAGGMFSFWQQLGRATRARGFVEGREILEGCVVPTIGGGICQLSNALYDAALHAGFEIIERHQHSKIIEGSMAEEDRDATVFWPHIDLRFRHRYPFQIRLELTADEFSVRIHSPASGRHTTTTRAASGVSEPTPAPRFRQTTYKNCLNCEQVACFRHHKHQKLAGQTLAQTAYLLDGYWPEFETYISQTALPDDIACTPVPLGSNTQLARHTRYGWHLTNINETYHTLLATALRGHHTSVRGAQGAARQRAILAWDDVLARLMARHLNPRVTRVVTSLDLLPFLWREGHLRGRRFKVLMTRLPLNNLHDRLQFAAKLHPQSRTLADFRAPSWLVEAESQALDAADRIITPHTAIAQLYPHKTTLLPWTTPPPAPPSEPAPSRPKARGAQPFTCAFPASTVGRKGAYELRAALKNLDIKLLILGQELEGPDFWHGYHTERCSDADWLTRADLVVMPAFIEHQPRLLLRAAAAGKLVVASTACGLTGVPGVAEIPPGDIESLRRALIEAQAQRAGDN